ncbi:MAG: nucleotidyltransferase domain-containing protein [Phycisphaerae bacterium]
MTAPDVLPLPLLEARRAELFDLCARHNVARLELFGSAATGWFDPERSDLDFLLELLPLSPVQAADAYLGLSEDLESLFGRRIDLVMPRAIRNRFFLESINRSRTLLYAA